MTLSVCVGCKKNINDVLLDSGSQRTFFVKSFADKLSAGGFRNVLPVEILIFELRAERFEGHIVSLSVRGNNIEQL